MGWRRGCRDMLRAAKGGGGDARRGEASDEGGYITRQVAVRGTRGGETMGVSGDCVQTHHSQILTWTLQRDGSGTVGGTGRGCTTCVRASRLRAGRGRGGCRHAEQGWLDGL
jgi:hypothetical protein